MLAYVYGVTWPQWIKSSWLGLALFFWSSPGAIREIEDLRYIYTSLVRCFSWCIYEILVPNCPVSILCFIVMKSCSCKISFDNESCGHWSSQEIDMFCCETDVPVPADGCVINSLAVITPFVPVMDTELAPSTGPPLLHLSLWWTLSLPPLLVPHHSICPCDGHWACPLYWSPITPFVPVMDTELSPSTGPPSLHLSLWLALCFPPLLVPHHSTCPCDWHCAFPLYWSPITPLVPVTGTVLAPSAGPHHSTCPCDGHCACPLYWSPVTPPVPVIGTVLAHLNLSPTAPSGPVVGTVLAHPSTGPLTNLYPSCLPSPSLGIHYGNLTWASRLK